MGLEIVIVPCLRDNYAYLLRDGAGSVAVVDAPEAGPIEAALSARGWTLDMILITHHHNDHTGGVEALRETLGATVVGASTAEVLDVPGHTVGHVAYYFADAEALFSADSLMVMGCGRLFEGTPAQMWRSLSRMAALPGATRVYSGHEYTAANTRFALSIDGDNPALIARAAEIEAARAKGLPTVPARLDLELATNPFLRARDPDLKARLGLPTSPDAQVFAEVRRRKDAY